MNRAVDAGPLIRDRLDQMPEFPGISDEEGDPQDDP